VSGGCLFARKGMLQDSSPRRMTVWLHEEPSSILSYGAPIRVRCLPQSGIAIEELHGTLVAKGYVPRDSF
jgi:hypothetical protein